MPLFARSQQPEPGPAANAPRRRLFMDDDPERARVFLAENPDAVWVQTAAECMAKLEERWDEVHLDHDLGGEHFVDLAREDCGMEVVRWLCLHPRPHLTRTRFLVHSHNPNAAAMMGMQMMVSGYTVEVRPFGAPPPAPRPEESVSPRPSPLQSLRKWVGRLLGRGGPEPLGYGYSEYDRLDPLRPEPVEPPLKLSDLDWGPSRPTPLSPPQAGPGAEPPQ